MGNKNRNRGNPKEKTTEHTSAQLPPATLPDDDGKVAQMASLLEKVVVAASVAVPVVSATAAPACAKEGAEVVTITAAALPAAESKAETATAEAPKKEKSAQYVPVFHNNDHARFRQSWETLFAKLKDVKDARALVLGCADGASVHQLATDILKGEGAKIHAVDPWNSEPAVPGALPPPDLEALFHQHLHPFVESGAVVTFKMPIEQFMCSYALQETCADEETRVCETTPCYDLVVIHTKQAYSTMIAAYWGWKLLKPGGIMLFDNVLAGWTPVKPSGKGGGVVQESVQGIKERGGVMLYPDMTRMSVSEAVLSNSRVVISTFLEQQVRDNDEGKLLSEGYQLSIMKFTADERKKAQEERKKARQQALPH